MWDTEHPLITPGVRIVPKTAVGTATSLTDNSTAPVHETGASTGFTSTAAAAHFKSKSIEHTDFRYAQLHLRTSPVCDNPRKKVRSKAEHNKSRAQVRHPLKSHEGRPHKIYLKLCEHKSVTSAGMYVVHSWIEVSTCNV